MEPAGPALQIVTSVVYQELELLADLTTSNSPELLQNHSSPWESSPSSSDDSSTMRRGPAERSSISLVRVARSEFASILQSRFLSSPRGLDAHLADAGISEFTEDTDVGDHAGAAPSFPGRVSRRPSIWPVVLDSSLATVYSPIFPSSFIPFRGWASRSVSGGQSTPLVIHSTVNFATGVMAWVTTQSLTLGRMHPSIIANDDNCTCVDRLFFLLSNE